MIRFLFILIFIFSGLELFGQGTGTVEFVTPDIRVEESAGDVSLFVGRKKSNLLPSSVDYRVTRSSATIDQDYSMTTQGTLNWGDGDEALKAIILTIIEDAEEEADEEIIIQLYNPSDGTYVGGADTARLTISGKESGQIGFAMPKFITSEFDGEALILVNRRDGLSGAVLVDYEVRPWSELDEGEHLGRVTHYRRLPEALFRERKVMPGVKAKSLQDFVPQSGTLLFLDYQSNATIGVNVLPNFDGDAYPHTVVEMALSNPRRLTSIEELEGVRTH